MDMDKVTTLATGALEAMQPYWYLPEAVYNGVDQVCSTTVPSLHGALR